MNESQQIEEELYQQSEPVYRQQPQPQPGMVAYPGQDPAFLSWLFDFKKSVTIPLRFLWRGYEQAPDGQWYKKAGNTRIMNEAGITWSISFIESFINAVYVVSNYAERDVNWTMRHVGQTVYNNLSCRYLEFGLHKLDINRVGIEVVSKIHAILLGAKDNGYRKFFSSTHQHQEVKSFSENTQSGGGLFGFLRGMRGGKNEPAFENRNY